MRTQKIPPSFFLITMRHKKKKQLARKVALRSLDVKLKKVEPTAISKFCPSIG